MIEVAGIILQNVGGVLILWAGVWLLWDKYAFRGTGTMLAFGLASLILGMAMAPSVLP